MNTITKFFSPNDIEIWAQESLSPEEHIQFQQALANNNAYFDSQRDSGKFVIEPVYETFHSSLLNTDIDVLVGEKFVFAPGSSLETDCAPIPEFNIWLQRFYTETSGDILIRSGT